MPNIYKWNRVSNLSGLKVSLSSSTNLECPNHHAKNVLPNKNSLDVSGTHEREKHLHLHKKRKTSKISKEKNPAHEPFRLTQNIFQEEDPEKTWDAVDSIQSFSVPLIERCSMTQRWGSTHKDRLNANLNSLICKAQHSGA